MNDKDRGWMPKLKLDGFGDEGLFAEEDKKKQEAEAAKANGGAPTNEAPAEQLVEQETEGQEAEGSKGPKKPITFTVFTSADKMTAYVRAADYERGKDADNRFDPAIIYELLDEKDISFGVDHDAIDEYSRGKSLFKDLEVAHGQRPVVGDDGYIEYFFTLERNSGPKVNSDGSVDYKELDLFENVVPGARLCRIHPPKEGIDGIDVTGKDVKAKKGREADIGCGPGTEKSADGLEIHATVGGMVLTNNGAVEVKEVFTVNGDVGPSTGNIRFNGAVVVKGNVLSDYSIFANGDIVVNGYVESSILTSAGNITIKNGVNGMKKGMIKADGDVTTKFAEMAKIIVGGDFHFDYCINCDVRAVGNIIGKGKRASLMGGSYIAGKCINISTAGSDKNLPMDLQIIPRWNEWRNLKLKPEERIKDYQEQVSALEHQIIEQRKLLEKIEEGILKVTKKAAPNEPPEITEAKKQKFRSLMQGKSQIKDVVAELKAKKERMDATMICEGCSVVINRIIHTGVRVTIGTANLRINGHKEVQTFVEEDGVIQAYNVVSKPE